MADLRTILGVPLLALYPVSLALALIEGDHRGPGLVALGLACLGLSAVGYMLLILRVEWRHRMRWPPDDPHPATAETPLDGTARE